jgi:hypothetical protein
MIGLGIIRQELDCFMNVLMGDTGLLLSSQNALCGLKIIIRRKVLQESTSKLLFSYKQGIHYRRSTITANDG